MDKKEGSSINFMPDDLLEIICILERGEKHNSYKIIRKRIYFSLITKFPAKNGEPTPLKNCASARGTHGCILGNIYVHEEQQLIRKRENYFLPTTSYLLSWMYIPPVQAHHLSA